MKNNLLIILWMAAASAHAQLPEWQFVRPDNTGTGGDYLQVVKGDCHGNLWTGGYMPFWSNGSVVRFDYEDTIYTAWGNYDGYLPADRVYDLAFDNNGGVWVATNGVGNGIAHGGIAHYDGTNWTQYTTANSPLPIDDMRGITVDGNNTVWATFYDVSNGQGGVAKFDGTNWNIYTPVNSNLQTSNVDKIKADSQNNIWIGTNMGLVKFDGLNWILYTPANSGLSLADVKDVEYDATTNKIYATTGIAVDIFDGTSWSHINSSNAPVSPTGMYAAYAEGDKVIIGVLASISGCFIYDGSIWSSHVATDHVYDVTIDANGNYWMSGIGFLEKSDGSNWTRYTRYNTGLVDYFNNDIFIDSKNRKWFANGQGGIQVFDCPKWEIYNPYNEGLFPSMQSLTPIGTSITEDSEGDIWITYDGTQGYAIQIPDGNYQNYGSWVLWDVNTAGAIFQSVTEAVADDSGNVYCLLWNGSVHKYSHAGNSWTNLNSGNSGLPPSGLNCVAARSGGRMYFGGYMNIYTLENGVWSSMNLGSLSLPATDVFEIAFDSNDHMWLGTDNGVFRFDGSNWTHWNETSGIAANHVTSIAFGGGDTVYIGAHNTQVWPYYGGMSMFNGTGWQSFLEGSSPIAHKQVEDVEIDPLGNLWILTQTEGITIYNPGGVLGMECMDRSLEICVTSSVSEMAEVASAIAAWPNPFSDQTTIVFNSDSEISSVIICDVLGKVIKRISTNELKAGFHKIDLDLSDVQSGIYYCHLVSDNKVMSAKLIKN